MSNNHKNGIEIIMDVLMKQFVRLTFSVLILLCAGCQNNSGTTFGTETATPPPPIIYPSQTMTPVKTETPTAEITSTPVDTHLDLGNIKPGQYLLAQAYEQDQDFLYFISTDKQIVQKLSLKSYIDIDSVFGGHFLNANFATSHDGSRFLIMRSPPKSSYLLNLETAQWDTLDIQQKCFTATWSPDNKTIALECFGGGINEIYFYDTISKSLEAVTDCTEKGDVCSLPNWSPDGRWLAYARSSGRSGPATGGLYVFDTSCVQNKNCVDTQIGPIESDSNPSWSVDNRLIFARSGIINSFDPKSRTFSKTSIHVPDSTLGIAIEPSPDGKYWAFSASKTSGEIIYLYSKETNHSDVLLDDHSILWIIGWVVIP
jgi:WD40-like Beta Propeller Repeat